MTITFERLNEMDVRVTGIPSVLRAYVKALRKAGLKIFKLSDRHYQVSFDQQLKLRQLLPPIGQSWDYKIGGCSYDNGR